MGLILPLQIVTAVLIPYCHMPQHSDRSFSSGHIPVRPLWEYNKFQPCLLLHWSHEMHILRCLHLYTICQMWSRFFFSHILHGIDNKASEAQYNFALFPPAMYPETMHAAFFRHIQPVGLQPVLQSTDHCSCRSEFFHFWTDNTVPVSDEKHALPLWTFPASA